MELRGKADPWDLGAVAALSILALLPLFFLDIGAGSLLGGDIVPLLYGLVPLLILVPLPAAYVATISRHHFRVETLGAAAALPLAFLGLQFTAFSIGLLLGLLLVSYKSRSIYTGDNQFWTFSRASTAVVTVLAVTLALTAAYAYDTSAPLRSDVQGNLTKEGVEVATGFIDLSQQGLSSGSLTGAATALAENVSRTSIDLTETAVFQEVDQDGSFSDRQKQVLRSAFSDSRQEIPSRISQQAGQQVEQEVGGSDGGDVERELIESRASPIIEEFTRPTLPVLALIFLAVLSTTYLLRFPVGLAGGIYGTAIYRLKKRRGSGEREDRDGLGIQSDG